jgi:hypothetical protein
VEFSKPEGLYDDSVEEVSEAMQGRMVPMMICCEMKSRKVWVVVNHMGC